MTDYIEELLAGQELEDGAREELMEWEESSGPGMGREVRLAGAEEVGLLRHNGPKEGEKSPDPMERTSMFHRDTQERRGHSGTDGPPKKGGDTPGQEWLPQRTQREEDGERSTVRPLSPSSRVVAAKRGGGPAPHLSRSILEASAEEGMGTSGGEESASWDRITQPRRGSSGRESRQRAGAVYRMLAQTGRVERMSREGREIMLPPPTLQPEGAVPIAGGGTARVGYGVEELDRIFQRDARRYDGGFALY